MAFQRGIPGGCPVAGKATVPPRRDKSKNRNGRMPGRFVCRRRSDAQATGRARKEKRTQRKQAMSLLGILLGHVSSIIAILIG
jgi:hypothetical protein